MTCHKLRYLPHQTNFAFTFRSEDPHSALSIMLNWPLHYSVHSRASTSQVRHCHDHVSVLAALALLLCRTCKISYDQRDYSRRQCSTRKLSFSFIVLALDLLVEWTYLLHYQLLTIDATTIA